MRELRTEHENLSPSLKASFISSGAEKVEGKESWKKDRQWGVGERAERERDTKEYGYVGT